VEHPQIVSKHMYSCININTVWDARTTFSPELSFHSRYAMERGSIIMFVFPEVCTFQPYK
jgi:hypothetical protein